MPSVGFSIGKIYKCKKKISNDNHDDFENQLADFQSKTTNPFGRCFCNFYNLLIGFDYVGSLIKCSAEFRQAIMSVSKHLKD
jgi:hypothetical protein